MRREGSEIVSLRPLNRSLTLLVSSTIRPKSDEDKDSSASSSNPVASTASSAACTISSMLRSRTGLVIIPAWQKRQPRVQPRMISIETRL